MDGSKATVALSNNSVANAIVINAPRKAPDSGVPPDQAYLRPRDHAEGPLAPEDNVGHASPAAGADASRGTEAILPWSSLNA